GNDAMDASIREAPQQIRVEATAWGDADLERPQVLRAAVTFLRVLQGRHGFHRAIEVAREAVPAVAVAHGAPECRRCSAADDDRRVRSLDWSWHRLNAAERDESSRIRWLLLGPDRNHRLEIFSGTRSLVREWDAERIELGLQIADAEAEEQSAIGCNVDA